MTARFVTTKTDLHSWICMLTVSDNFSSQPNSHVRSFGLERKSWDEELFDSFGCVLLFLGVTILTDDEAYDEMSCTA